MGTVTQYNMANIQAALGGSNPISLNEYYRGGPYVPTTATSTTRDPSSGEYYNDQYIWIDQNFLGNYSTWFYWAAVYQFVGSFQATSYTSGNVTTYRGGLVTQYTDKGGTRRQFGIYRQTTTSVAINTGVPSSGTISIGQLFGARNP